MSVETNTAIEGATPYSRVLVEYISVATNSAAHQYCMLWHANKMEFKIKELLDLIPDEELGANWLAVKYYET